MMIMAQHPQQQRSHQLTGNSSDQNQNKDQRQRHQQQQHVASIQPQIKTSISEQQQQDGKRTLIKNQLYLIEQLQLENANLRNERDQLQLENEELKFQLQMISSSNILNQPGPTFNNQQLEQLVRGDGKTTNHYDDLATAPAVKPKQQLVTMSVTKVLTNSVTTNAKPTTNSLGNQVKLPNATPLRQPMRQAGDSRQELIQEKVHSTPQQPLVRLPRSTIAFAAAATTSKVASDTKRHWSGCTTTTATNCDVVPTANLNSPAATNKELLSGKSTSLATFNVESCNSTFPQSRNLLQDDEEERRVKLVVQLYGGDSGQLREAAIVIQRAFRKYQICKRFRTITEQLRRTYRHQSPSSSFSSSSSASSSSSTTSIINQAERKRPAILTTNTCDVRPSSLSSTGSALTNNTALSVDKQSVEVPFASGTTRAAAWESLSYAASQLAASATAAASGVKQTLANGVAKVSSQQQQQAAIISSQVKPSTENNRVPTAASVTNLSTTISSTNSTTTTSTKQDSVVAAAINFQQLESIRKRQYRVGLNIFNKNPEEGVSFLVAHSFVDSSSPFVKTTTSYYLSNQLHFMDKQHFLQQQQQLKLQRQPTLSTSNNNIPQTTCQLCCEEDNLKHNIAHFLLHRKGLAKEKIGQYLGNLQEQFNQDVLKYYLQELDFYGLQIDLALRKFLSTFRLPGEAQKIERIVDCFAQRYVQCQQQQQLITSNNVFDVSPPINPIQDVTLLAAPQTTAQQRLQQSQNYQQVTNKLNYKNNLILLSKDEIFILTFAIIMLNTDLHSPSLKPTSRMSALQFVNNLRGVFKSQTINESDLIEIYERVKANQITTTPDHVTHVMKVQQGLTVTNFQRKELPNLCVPHRRLVCFCRLFEVYDVNKKEKPGQHQREIFLFNDLLLVTKLARRVRANTTQLYTYRQSISLQGLYVQLFQSPHYNFGIRLCQRSNDETLIMFNARNELDQSRFVDDLGESIAEMDEMERIKRHNIVETIHFKYLKKLRRHTMMHTGTENNIQAIDQSSDDNETNKKMENCDTNDKQRQQLMEQDEKHSEDASSSASSTSSSSPPPLPQSTTASSKSTTPTLTTASDRTQSKFCSMLNLSNASDEHNDTTSNNNNAMSNMCNQQAQATKLRMNKSFVQAQQLLLDQQADDSGRRNQQNLASTATATSVTATSVTQRRTSTSSVHSLDSGLFLSRDVSPNQSN